MYSARFCLDEFTLGCEKIRYNIATCGKVYRARAIPLGFSKLFQINPRAIRVEKLVNEFRVVTSRMKIQYTFFVLFTHPSLVG